MVKTSVFITYFLKIFLAQQNLEGHKKFREDCPPMPPVATGLIPISGYLAKPTVFDKTK